MGTSILVTAFSVAEHTPASSVHSLHGHQFAAAFSVACSSWLPFWLAATCRHLGLRLPGVRLQLIACRRAQPHAGPHTCLPSQPPAACNSATLRRL